MKLTLCLVSSLLLLGGSLFAQVPGMMTMQPASVPQGTDLGANNTVNAAGIALGNRVKLRGFVDFAYSHLDNELDTDDDRFTTAADVDFLLDFSPITAEVHLYGTTGIGNNFGIEQAFGRYAFNRDFNITFGRQVTNLGYEGDEPTDLHAVSNAYLFDIATKHPANVSLGGALGLPTAHFRKNYVDGVRANFNNGRFGLSLGLHDKYWVKDDLNDNIALDIAASLMIVPGLEARLGYAHEELDSNEITQFNTWIGYSANDLTLALEYDNFDLAGTDLWDIMILANYQFTNLFGLTFRYAHEDLEIGATNLDSNRFTLAFLFAVTSNFGVNVEYSHTKVDTNNVTIGDGDINEFYVEGLLTF
jgi:hypothetical protein